MPIKAAKAQGQDKCLILDKSKQENYSEVIYYIFFIKMQTTGCNAISKINVTPNFKIILTYHFNTVIHEWEVLIFVINLSAR